MAVFRGSVRLAGESGSGLRAEVRVEEGRLALSAGDHEIGIWPLTDLTITRTDQGFRLAVEGEELVLTVADQTAFAQSVGILFAHRETARPTERRQPRTPDTPASPPTGHHPPAATEEQAANSTAGRRFLAAIAALRPEVKLVAVGIAAAVVLGVFAPIVLAFIFVLSGGIAFLVGILAVLDSYVAVRLPRGLSASLLLGVGFALILAGVAVVQLT